MAKTKMQIFIETKIGKAQEDLNTLKKQVQSIGNETGKTDKKVGFFSRNVKKLGDTLKNNIGKITGVVASVTALGVAYFNMTEQVRKNKKQVEQSTGATGFELDKLTVKVQSLSDVYREDFNEILIASNTVAKEFGISQTKALDLVEEGFLKGSNASNEYLKILKEYPTQLKSIGLDADTTFKLINQQVKEGIYSDKGIDALKEAGLRLREMPDATKKALDAVGLSSKEISKSLEDGTQSIFDVIQTVSKELSSLNPTAKTTQELITNVFGSAGEDAGARYLGLLQNINTEQDTYNQELTGTEELQKQSLESTEAINKALFKLADNTTIIKAWNGIKIVFAETLLLLNDMFTVTSDFEKNLEKLQGLGFDTTELQTAKQLQEDITANLERRTEIQKENAQLERDLANSFSRSTSEAEQQAKELFRISAQRKIELLSLEKISDVEEQRVIANNNYLNTLKEQAGVNIRLDNLIIENSKNENALNTQKIESLSSQKEELILQSNSQAKILDDTIEVLSQRRESVMIEKELKAQELEVADATAKVLSNTKETNDEAKLIVNTLSNIKTISENIEPVDLFGADDEEIDVQIQSAQEIFTQLQEMRVEANEEKLNEKAIALEKEKITEEEFLQFKLDLNNRELQNLTNLLNNEFITQQVFDKKRRALLLQNAKFESSINKTQVKASNDLSGINTANQLANLDLTKNVGSQVLNVFKAEAIGALIKSIFTSTPFPLNILLAGGAGAIANGIFNSIPKFEDGAENGFVAGNSFTGDKVLARVNSGEAILNQSQQRNFLDLATGRNSGGNDSKIAEAIAENSRAVESLATELAFNEKNIEVTNQIDVTPTDFLDITERGQRNRDIRSNVG